VLALGQHARTIAQARTAWPMAAGVHIAHNSAPDGDPAGSLLVALRQLSAHPKHPVMVPLADQPLLAASDIGQACNAFMQRAKGIELVLPSVEGRLGHPVVMSGRVAQALTAGKCQCLQQWPAPNARKQRCLGHRQQRSHPQTAHPRRSAGLAQCVRTRWAVAVGHAPKIRVNPNSPWPLRASENHTKLIKW
jgi:hypothetical protein